MANVSTIGSILLRIVLGYLAASIAASVLMFLVSLVMSIGHPPVAGRTAFDDLANQVGWIPFFTLVAGIFAAPGALLCILVSEVAKIHRLWFFLAIGALGSIPVLFIGDERSITSMLEGFLLLGSIGALSGGAYWLVRHRKWPV